MRKVLLLSVCILFSLTVQSQEWDFQKPNYKKIKKNIQDEDSHLFYPVLLKRYKAADSSLTLEEKRHLYYGYTFQDAYDPYGISDLEKKVEEIFNENEFSDSDLDLIIAYSDSLLQKDPFDVRAMNTQLFAFKKKGDEEKFNQNLFKLHTIVDALISTGDGIEKESAIYVIDTSHEYFFLNIMGFDFGGSQSLIETYDYLTLAENSAGIEGFYFDVSRLLNKLNIDLGE